ncbi:MAG: single-stranded DNA-binding protein [Fusobacterium sp.]
MNIIILTGRLTRDPELKTGQSGKAYARFPLAVERPMQKDETDFINCVAFGKTAELIGEYLRKGRKAGVTGRLQMGKYEVNGEKRTSYDVIVDSIEFLESKNTVNSTEETTQQNRSTQSSNTSKPVGKKSEEVPYEDDDEFPF